MNHFIRFKLLLIALFASLSASVASVAGADVVVVVSANSQISGLDANQISDIFLGRTSTLPNGGQVVPIDLMEGSSTRDEFYAKLTGNSAAKIKAHWSKIIFTGRGLPPKAVTTLALFPVARIFMPFRSSMDFTALPAGCSLPGPCA